MRIVPRRLRAAWKEAEEEEMTQTIMALVRECYKGDNYIECTCEPDGRRRR